MTALVPSINRVELRQFQFGQDRLDAATGHRVITSIVIGAQGSERSFGVEQNQLWQISGGACLMGVGEP